MKIVRKLLVTNRIVTLSNVLNESVLFEMGKEDIDEDGIICKERLDANNSIYVFQNNDSNHFGERYCYIKVLNRIGGDGITKAIVVEKIITDSKLIDVSLFETIFKIMFQQESGTSTNRIIIGKYNERFPLKTQDTASNIAEYLFNCYTTFTTDDYPEYDLISPSIYVNTKSQPFSD